MQVITAKNKNHALPNYSIPCQQEPVLVTKNKCSVGVFLSLKDVKGSHLENLFDIQNDNS